MGLFSDYFENLANEQLDKNQVLVSDLYTGWISITTPVNTKQDTIKALNNALKLVDGLKTLHSKQADFYSQNVTDCHENIAVYYCKHTNTIKSI